MLTEVQNPNFRCGPKNGGCSPLRPNEEFCHSSAQVIFKQGETDMGDKGKKDKGKREQQKKSQVTPKEKRKLKKEKKK